MRKRSKSAFTTAEAAQLKALLVSEYIETRPAPKTVGTRPAQVETLKAVAW
jgi:hypothetical protein